MKNSLGHFVVGLIMLVVGLFWLTSTVQVTMGWGAGWRVGGYNVTGGMALVPLIVSIVWLFFNPKSMGAKILMVLGGIIIVAGIIMSVRFHMVRTNLYEFILILVFIAGGAGLTARTLFAGSGGSKDEEKSGNGKK